MLLSLVAVLLSAEPNPRVSASTVACTTVAECWLDADGKPIARPKKFKGKPLPTGDCGKRLVWLRNQLTCDETQKVCVAEHVGDKC
jgi:hypothetical protein